MSVDEKVHVHGPRRPGIYLHGWPLPLKDHCMLPSRSPAGELVSWLTLYWFTSTGTVLSSCSSLVLHRSETLDHNCVTGCGLGWPCLSSNTSGFVLQYLHFWISGNCCSNGPTISIPWGPSYLDIATMVVEDGWDPNTLLAGQFYFRSEIPAFWSVLAHVGSDAPHFPRPSFVPPALLPGAVPLTMWSSTLGAYWWPWGHRFWLTYKLTVL